MAEFSAALLVLIPLILLAYLGLHLLRLGMSIGELTDVARQKLVGFGLLLLYLVILACITVLGSGLYLLFAIQDRLARLMGQ